MSKRSNSEVGMKKDTHLTSTSVALNRRRFSLGLPLLAAGAAAPQEVVAAKAPSRDEAPIVKLNTFRAKLCRKHAHARDIATRPIEANRRLLRACRQRPNCCRAAEQGDELAALHSGHGELPPLSDGVYATGANRQATALGLPRPQPAA